MDRPAWNLLTGTLTSYVLLAVTIGMGVFLMPFTIGHLGKAEYGLWMLAASLTAYLHLLDLGYGNGLVRQITQADARGDEALVNDVLSTFLVVYTAIAAAALAAVAALVLVVVPRFPNLSPADVRTAQWVLGILGLRVAIAFPMGIFGAVTTARQRFALTGQIAIALTLLQGLATFVVLEAGYGLVPLVAVTTGIGIAGYAAYWAAARATFPGMRLSPSRFSRQQVREVTSFSLYLFLISIAIHVGASVDTLVIGAYLGTSAIAVYTVALRLMEYQRQLCGQFSGYLFPLVVRFDATRDVDALRVTLVDGTRIALGLVTCVALGLAAFGKDLVTLWMGGGFADAIGPLYVLVVAGLVMVAQGPSGTILLGAGRHRLVAGASLLDIALNVAFSVALVSSLGLTGVAIGTLLPYAVLNLLILVPAACRVVGVPVRRFAAEAAVPSLVAAAPAAVVALLFRSSAVLSSLPGLALASAVVGLVYAATFVLLGLRPADRSRYLGSLRRVAPALDAGAAAS